VLILYILFESNIPGTRALVGVGVKALHYQSEGLVIDAGHAGKYSTCRKGSVSLETTLKCCKLTPEMLCNEDRLPEWRMGSVMLMDTRELSYFLWHL
jgi:hypothetical protein